MPARVVVVGSANADLVSRRTAPRAGRDRHRRRVRAGARGQGRESSRGARRRVRLPVVVEASGGVAILAGAALTGVQWHGFAPIFGIVTALGLVAIGMFPGEGRAPILIFVSGALILAVAVLLTRESRRFRRELAGQRHERLPPRDASY